MPDKKMEDIEKVIVYFLLHDGIFYASLISQMRRIANKDLPGRMGVKIKNGRIELGWNPDKLGQLKDIKEKAAICEHVCEHIVKNHVGRKKNKNQELWNIACDLAINQTIKNLPSDAIGLKDFPQSGMASDKAANYYYWMLNKEGYNPQTNRFKDGKGTIKIKSPVSRGETTKDINSTDTHEGWDKIDGNDAMNQQVLKTAVQKAVEQTKRMRGTVPGHLKDDIDALTRPAVIPWSQVVRDWVGNKVKSGIRYSLFRPSRRFGYYHKGRLPKRLLSIAVVVDSSGSMSNPDLQDAFTEIRGLLEVYRSKITLMEVDIIVQSVQELKPYTKTSFVVKGRGGTSFKPAFKYIETNKLPIDLVIYFTDLMGDFPDPPPKYPVLWVTVAKDDYKVPFGKLISIPAAKSKKGIYN